MHIPQVFKNLDKYYKPFIVCSIFLLLLLAVANNFQRSAAVNEIKSFTMVNRRMLNSRAKIQIILIEAAMAQRPLSPSEIDTIGNLWKNAEFDQTKDIILPEDDK